LQLNFVHDQRNRKALQHLDSPYTYLTDDGCSSLWRMFLLSIAAAIDAVFIRHTKNLNIRAARHSTALRAKESGLSWTCTFTWAELTQTLFTGCLLESRSECVLLSSLPRLPRFWASAQLRCRTMRSLPRPMRSQLTNSAAPGAWTQAQHIFTEHCNSAHRLGAHRLCLPPRGPLSYNTLFWLQVVLAGIGRVRRGVRVRLARLRVLRGLRRVPRVRYVVRITFLQFFCSGGVRCSLRWVPCCNAVHGVVGLPQQAGLWAVQRAGSCTARASAVNAGWDASCCCGGFRNGLTRLCSAEVTRVLSCQMRSVVTTISHPSPLQERVLRLRRPVCHAREPDPSERGGGQRTGWRQGAHASQLRTHRGLRAAHAEGAGAGAEWDYRRRRPPGLQQAQGEPVSQKLSVRHASD